MLRHIGTVVSVDDPVSILGAMPEGGRKVTGDWWPRDIETSFASIVPGLSGSIGGATAVDVNGWLNDCW